MAIEIRKVPKDGCEDFFFQAQEKIEHLDSELEAKVNEYRDQLVAEFADKKARLNNILELVSEDKEFEVPDPVAVAEEVPAENAENVGE